MVACGAIELSEATAHLTTAAVLKAAAIVDGWLLDTL
jgi:hypothetical protein